MIGAILRMNARLRIAGIIRTSKLIGDGGTHVRAA